MTITSPHSPQEITPPQGTSSSTVSSNAVSSNTALPPASETVRLRDPIAFAPPITDAAGMSVTVLRPEKVKGGVRLTFAMVNTNDIPITVDTAAIGPHDARFNDVTVPMTMTPARKKLVPGEGYTYQCVLKLPTMDVGTLSFFVGTTSVTGPAAGD